MCEAYEVGWEFVIAPEQQQGWQQWQPVQNLAASHTREGLLVWEYIADESRFYGSGLDRQQR